MPSTTEVTVQSANSESWRRVVDDRVVCQRLGEIAISRCRECDYLIRLGPPESEGRQARYVICRERDIESLQNVVWWPSAE